LIPHLALHVPDEELEPYLKLGWTDPPDSARYTPHFTPRAAYAAMITRLDRYVGRILDLLDELKLADNTIVVFSSDNGATYLGPMAEFFNSVDHLRGLKGQSYEGGLRVPAIVRYPGKVAAGSTSDRVSGFEDWTPTLMKMVGGDASMAEGTDGIDFSATLLGKKQEPRDFLYREFAGYGGHQAVWVGKWKAIRTKLSKTDAPFELYDLEADEAESKDLAQQFPEVVERLRKIADKEHEASPEFPLKGIDR
jgi:arylsulfatase A-like enzyme